MSQLYGINDPGMSEEDFLDMLEEFGRDCERWRYSGTQSLDGNYGFRDDQAFWTKDDQTLIIIPVTERDAKLIEAGFANIGDFKVFAPYSYDIKAHDIVYDPVKNMYLELEEIPSIPVIQITGICKIFKGKVTNRPVPP